MLNTIVNIIKKIDFFNGLNNSDLIDLATNFNTVRFTKGDIVIKEGDQTDKDLYIIIEGQVDVKVNIRNNQILDMLSLNQSQIFGELSLVSGANRSATVVAATDIVTIVLPKENIDQLCEQNNHLGMVLYKNIANILATRIKDQTEIIKGTIT